MGYVDNVIHSMKEQTKFYVSYYPNFTEYEMYLGRNISEFEKNEYNSAVRYFIQRFVKLYFEVENPEIIKTTLKINSAIKVNERPWTGQGENSTSPNSKKIKELYSTIDKKSFLELKSQIQLKQPLSYEESLTEKLLARLSPSYLDTILGDSKLSLLRENVLKRVIDLLLAYHIGLQKAEATDQNIRNKTVENQIKKILSEQTSSYQSNLRFHFNSMKNLRKEELFLKEKNEKIKSFISSSLDRGMGTNTENKLLKELLRISDISDLKELNSMIKVSKEEKKQLRPNGPITDCTQIFERKSKQKLEYSISNSMDNFTLFTECKKKGISEIKFVLVPENVYNPFDPIELTWIKVCKEKQNYRFFQIGTKKGGVDVFFEGKNQTDYNPNNSKILIPNEIRYVDYYMRLAPNKFVKEQHIDTPIAIDHLGDMEMSFESENRIESGTIRLLENDIPKMRLDLKCIKYGLKNVTVRVPLNPQTSFFKDPTFGFQKFCGKPNFDLNLYSRYFSRMDAEPDVMKNGVSINPLRVASSEGTFHRVYIGLTPSLDALHFDAHFNITPHNDWEMVAEPEMPDFTFKNQTFALGMYITCRRIGFYNLTGSIQIKGANTFEFLVTKKCDTLFDRESAAMKSLGLTIILLAIFIYYVKKPYTPSKKPDEHFAQPTPYFHSLYKTFKIMKNQGLFKSGFHNDSVSEVYENYDSKESSSNKSGEGGMREVRVYETQDGKQLSESSDEQTVQKESKSESQKGNSKSGSDISFVSEDRGYS